jgi:hypothetical protein
VGNGGGGGECEVRGDLRYDMSQAVCVEGFSCKLERTLSVITIERRIEIRHESFREKESRGRGK